MAHKHKITDRLSPPVRRPRRRDPHRPRHGLEILPAQQTHHHLTLAPGREPTPTAAPGGRAGRHRFLNVLPHLDTPPARTLSQSSVQENPRAQDQRRRDILSAKALSDLDRQAFAGKQVYDGCDVTDLVGQSPS